MAPISPLIQLGIQGCSTPLTSQALLTIKSAHANWVIPGRVMCGPYPGLDGINHPDLAAAESNLQALLADGIDTFVCLQAEIPPVGTSPMPTSVTPYFPVFEHYHTTVNRIHSTPADLQFHHLPIPDQTTPAKSVFVQHMTTLAEAYMAGRNIYIHCAGGHGRTGMYVAALLLAIFRRQPHVTPEYVLQYVQFAHDKRRIQDQRCSHMLFVPSPNTPEQRTLVHEFATYLSFL